MPAILHAHGGGYILDSAAGSGAANRPSARAGIPVERHGYPGAYHGFEMAGDTSKGRRFRADCRAALKDAFQVQV